MITTEMLEELDIETMIKLRRKMREIVNKKEYLPFFAKMLNAGLKEEVLTSSNTILITPNKIELINFN